MRFRSYALIVGVLSGAMACGPTPENARRDAVESGAFDAMTNTIEDAEQVEELSRQQKKRLDAVIETSQEGG